MRGVPDMRNGPAPPFDRLRVVSKVEPQAQTVGELTRRRREGGRRGSDLLTQAGRFPPEEPYFSRKNLEGPCFTPLFLTILVVHKAYPEHREEGL